MKNILKLTILFSLILTIDSCGRKGPKEYPGGQKSPDFEKVLDPGVRGSEEK